MYHCRLNIAVFCQDSELGETLRRVQPLERFEHTYVWRNRTDCDALREGQVILWNIPEQYSPREVRELCGAGAVLIFCASHDAIVNYRGEDLAAADEFWETPLAGEVVLRRFGRLMERIKLEHDLYLARACLDTAIDSIPDMVWFKAADGAHVKVNKAFCSTVGKSREDVTGRDHCYIWDVSREEFENGDGVCRETEEAVMRERKTLQFVEKVKSKRGLRQFRTYKSPLFDMDGDTILGTVGVGHDVTDLVNLSTELEILLSSMPYAILLRDDSGCILNINDKFEEYFGVNEARLLGMQYDEWFGLAFEEERNVNTEGFMEARVRHADGAPGRILEIHENTIYDIFQNVVGKLCIFRDVTMERRLEAQILKNSNTDFMTGLYNRRYLYQYLHDNSFGNMVSLLYVDLDNFKYVNDTYGHQVGDDALILTADLLRECFRNEFVARVGGDEFLVVRLGDCGIEELTRNAQNLLDRMREEFGDSECLKTLSASVGIAQGKDPSLDIDLLIQQSDSALYMAKEMGKSRFCVFDAGAREKSGC